MQENLLQTLRWPLGTGVSLHNKRNPEQIVSGRFPILRNADLESSLQWELPCGKGQGRPRVRAEAALRDSKMVLGSPVLPLHSLHPAGPGDHGEEAQDHCDGELAVVRGLCIPRPREASWAEGSWAVAVQLGWTRALTLPPPSREHQPG